MRRLSIVLAMSILCSFTAMAQWVQTNGPYGGSIQCLAVNGNSLMAGTEGFGAFLSTDYGETWSTFLPTNLTPGPCGYTIRSLAALTDSEGTVAFAGTDWGIFASTDNGASWQANGLNAGCPGGGPSISVKSLAFSSQDGVSYLFAGTDSGVYRTPVRGTAWTRLNRSLADTSTSYVFAFADSGVNYIFASTYRGLYRSTENGESWVAVGVGCYASSFVDFSYGGHNELLANFCSGLWRSTDHGTTWTNIGWGSGRYPGVGGLSASPDGSTIFVFTDTCMLRSTDNGTTWSPIRTAFDGFYGRYFAYMDSSIFAGTGTGVFRSTDGGISWVAVDNGMIADWVVCLAAAHDGGQHIYAWTHYDGMFCSTNNGASWNRINNGLGGNPWWVASIAASTDSGGTIVYAAAGYGGLFRSYNNGDNWSSIDSGVRVYKGPTITYPNFTSIAVFTTGSGTMLYAGTSQAAVYSSTDNGSTWNYVGSFTGDPEHSEPILSFVLSGTNLIAGTGYGIFLSTDGGATWNEVDPRPAEDESRPYVSSLVSTGSYVFGAGWFGVYRSTDYGMHWNGPICGGMTLDIKVDDSDRVNVFAGTWDGKIWLSKDSGATWIQADDGLLSNPQIAHGPRSPNLVSAGSDAYGRAGGGLGSGIPAGMRGASSGPVLPRSVAGASANTASMTENGATLFAGLSENVWRRPFSEMIPFHIRSIITATAGDNGTILPSGIVKVDTGDNQQFTITPREGSHLDSLIVDGALVDSTTSYTFIHVTAPHAIRATFKINNYTIIASAGANGRIVPSGTVAVLYGDNPRFTMTPDSGYHVDSLIVDGGKKGPALVYRFDNVAANHTVVAFFSVGEPCLTVQVSSHWNILSTPLVARDYHRSMIFPTATSEAFRFQAVYKRVDSLAIGAGYWLEFSYDQAFPLLGDSILTYSVGVVEGWNLIGSISCPVVASSVMSDPPAMMTSEFYGYRRGYHTSDTIQPGQGYWVKVYQSGLLILASPGTALVKSNILSRIRVIPIPEMPPPPPDAPLHDQPMPASFSLGQNFPNPFNPTTTITYQLPKQSQVKLTIFDVLGREIATLVDGEQTPGYKSVTWNAGNVPSGIYFYRLQTKEFTQTRKLLLLK
jgi:photosystem II stability/assembly factor-like uncharacterized protein